MNGVLSNEVKQALRDIYYDVRTGRGAEAFAMLEKASEAGDGDATCVLARCLCGYQYVWREHRHWRGKRGDKGYPGLGDCRR